MKDGVPRIDLDAKGRQWWFLGDRRIANPGLTATAGVGDMTKWPTSYDAMHPGAIDAKERLAYMDAMGSRRWSRPPTNGEAGQPIDTAHSRKGDVLSARSQLPQGMNRNADACGKREREGFTAGSERCRSPSGRSAPRNLGSVEGRRMRRPYERGLCGAVGVEFPKFRLDLPPAFSGADVGLRFANPTYGFPTTLTSPGTGRRSGPPVTACV